MFMILHLFARQGTAGALRYPEHLALAFLYEVYLLALALALALGRPLLTAFFYVTPLVSLAVTLASGVASIQAYYRVKENPLAASGEGEGEVKD
jgi:pheromone shutdown protein TraB